MTDTGAPSPIVYTTLPTQTPFPTAQPPPYPSYQDASTMAPPPGYAAQPQAGYYMVGEQTPLVATPVYIQPACDADQIRHEAYHMRRRGIWQIVLGIILMVITITVLLVLVFTETFWFFSFTGFFFGIILIFLGIQNIRRAHHLQHHCVLP